MRTISKILLSALLVCGSACAADYFQFSYNNQGLPGVPSLGGPLQWYTCIMVHSDAVSVTVNLNMVVGSQGYSQPVVNGGAFFFFLAAPQDINGPPTITEHFARELAGVKNGRLYANDR